MQLRRRILIVEDEEDLGRLVLRQLKQANYEATAVTTGEQALQAVAKTQYDLILLDINLPGIDGFQTCRRLRDQKQLMPIVMLTARSTEVDKVLGLETGADDYVTKPFGMPELLARIKAIFRRIDSSDSSLARPNQSVVIGDGLVINAGSREVIVRGTATTLTHREFDLLWHFVRNPGHVFTRAQLLDAVWGYSHEGYEHAINCHINRLRAKIERDPSRPAMLLTVWGVGYKFAAEPGA